jgi:uncharacterized protein
MSPEGGAAQYKVSDYIVAARSAYRDGGEGDDDAGAFRPVFSTRTGATRLISEALFAQLSAGTVPDDPAMIADLAAAELIVPKCESTPREFDTLRRRNMRATREQPIATFNLSPTSFCNFGCIYCGQAHSKGRMSEATAAAIERRVAVAAGSPEIGRVHVCWFGGEPSAAIDVVETLSARLIATCDAAETPYTAEMVTNGSLLDLAAIESLVETCRITRFCITIDGPREIHDRSRPNRNRRGSFDHIIDLLAAVAAEPSLAQASFVVRTNISRLNRDSLFALFSQCAQRGLDAANISFQLIPVYAWSNDVSDIEIDKRDYARFEIALIDHMLGLGLRVALLPETPHPIVCVAVDRRAEVIGPDGACFSCTEHVLVPRHAKDAVGAAATTASPRATGMFDGFNRDAVRELPCARCVMFGICGGACPKHWREGSEPCPSFKYNLRERLDLAARRGGMRAVD